MNTITKPKSVLYCRVSSKEQEDTGYSLDAQEKLLSEYAADKFKVAKVFRISESASGKQIRKTFNEMLQYVEKNRVPIILCEKIDRLTRNLDLQKVSGTFTSMQTIDTISCYGESSTFCNRKYGISCYQSCKCTDADF